MRRLLPGLLGLITLTAGACAVNVGGEKDIALPTVAIGVDHGASASAVAAALKTASPKVALVMGPADAAWYQAVATGTGYTMVGPATLSDDVGSAFYGLKAVGDTAIVLEYDGGQVTLQDALYDMGDKRFLDLLAFQVVNAGDARPLVASLLQYVATDVEPSAAIVMAVTVPSEVVGDSVARMFSPGFDEAGMCEGASRSGADGRALRLFYGPQARVYCRTASAEAAAVGDWIEASLVMGRRD